MLGFKESSHYNHQKKHHERYTVHRRAQQQRLCSNNCLTTWAWARLTRHLPGINAYIPLIYILDYSPSSRACPLQNISCVLGKEKKAITILHGVSGYFEKGTLTSLIGPSGSGKTTLLDIIAGRKTTGRITGKVTFAGRQPSRNFLRHFTAYVEQFGTNIKYFVASPSFSQPPSLTIHRCRLPCGEFDCNRDAHVYCGAKDPLE